MGRKDGKISCLSLVCLMLILSTYPIHAELSADEFFDFLSNDTSITSVTDIEYDNSKITTPDNWDTSGYVRAKIDISGYWYMTEFNGIKYINQTPEAAAYINYEAEHIMHGKRFWSSNVDLFEHNITKIDCDGTTVTATLETKLNYHTSVLRCRATVFGVSCRIDKTYYTQTANFTATDTDIPHMYPSNISTQKATVVIYNNSMPNKTVISIPFSDYMLGYKVEFKNETIEYFINTMRVDYLENGFPYGNVSPAPTQSIYEDSDLFYRLGRFCMINDTDIDDSLKIYAMTPYAEQEMQYEIEYGPTGLRVNQQGLIGIFTLLALCGLLVFYYKYFRGYRR